ncbi:hypothetical protein BREVNS_0447 [Brevinematales bacterium NS]|nr:hypothetical protein [Brevinematales bacterium]QJR21197.1 hypothetical protein BREVNS_0447 [Brevinematales bacterium NS]
MWKTYLVFVLCFFEILYADDSSYEALLVPEKIAGFFQSEKEIKEYAKTNTTALGYYTVGVFYLYHAYGLVNTLKVSKKDYRRLTREAITSLEKAQKLAPAEPMILSMLGSAYLFSCQWGGASDRMRNGRKGVFYMDKAVIMAPSHLNIRENRLRSYINLPPEYFPNIFKSIPEDADMLLKAMEKDFSLYGAYAKEVKSLCFYAKGLVAYYQKEMGKAKQFLGMVETGTSFSERAKALLKKMGE